MRTEDIVCVVTETLPDFQRAPALEVNKVLCFQAEDRTVCVDQSSSGQLWLWWVRGKPLRETLFETAPSPGHESITLGPFRTDDAQGVKRWLEHYAKNGALIDFTDPFLEDFRDALLPLDEEIACARQYLYQKVRDKVLGLAETHAEVVLPMGVVSVGERAEEAWKNRVVPAILVATWVPRPGSLEWAVDGLGLEFESGAPLSKNQWLALARKETSAMIEDHRNGGTTLEKDGLWVRLGQEGATSSKSFALKCNAGRGEVRRFLDSIQEDDWLDIQTRKDTEGDPLTVLLDRLEKQPDDLQTCRRAAAILEKRGEAGQAHLVLAKGYLKAGRRSIARGKLELAERTDPSLPGLSEVWEEWRQGEEDG